MVDEPSVARDLVRSRLDELRVLVEIGRDLEGPPLSYFTTTIHRGEWTTSTVLTELERSLLASRPQPDRSDGAGSWVLEITRLVGLSDVEFAGETVRLRIRVADSRDELALERTVGLFFNRLRNRCLAPAPIPQPDDHDAWDPGSGGRYDGMSANESAMAHGAVHYRLRKGARAGATVWYREWTDASVTYEVSVDALPGLPPLTAHRVAIDPVERN